MEPNTDRPFLRGFKRGKIQRLQQRRIAWEYAALAVQPTVRGVQAFNGIGGVDYHPHILGKLEDSCNNLWMMFRFPSVIGPGL